MNKIPLIILGVGIVAVIGIFSMGSPNKNTALDGKPNVEIKDGVQYIHIGARGGYSPEISTAKAGIPTKLIVATNGTYDCSASLVIHSLNFQKILPQTGETEIDIGIPKVGEPLEGVCGMGMYNFQVNFTS